MANGRKGQKVSGSSTAGGAGASAGTPRKRWPEAAAADGDAAAPGADDLVAVVRGLAAAVAEHNLSELVVDTPEVTFTLRRGVATVGVAVAPAAPVAAAPALHGLPGLHGSAVASHVAAPGSAPAGGPAPAPAEHDDKSHAVTSPFVGTFYRRPNPDSPEYVKVNDKVRKGQVLCIVEAMKLMNEIEADVDGTIVGILAEDGAPVEYGQPLFKIAS